MINKNFLQVAVGVVKNANNQILIALRNKASHQGGLWEFPGGKVEEGETHQQALARELKEEVDIVVTSSIPLITVRHHYPEISVQLNVFLVENFSGQAKGLQDQEIRWIDADELDHFEFPKANRTIITAIQLPPCYAIIDDTNEPLIFAKLQKMLSNGVKLIQARLKSSSAATVKAFLEQAYPLCKQHNAWLLVNSAVEQTDIVQVDGIHLTSNDLLTISQRPANMRWVSASCHNLEQLQQAQKIGVDFVVLAPVLPTQSHPGVQTLGWQRFTALATTVNFPVYALGGMSLSNLASARQAGAQGIAGISAFLD